MTVQRIEFSGQYLRPLNQKDLIEYFNINPHLVASYQIFPDVVRRGGEEPALVVETNDLSDEQLRIFAVGMRLITGKLRSVNI